VLLVISYFHEGRSGITLSSFVAFSFEYRVELSYYYVKGIFPVVITSDVLNGV